MQDESLTRTVIGCAYQVHNKMGFGFLESVYERSLLIELAKAGIQALPQQKIKVYYDGQVVGKFRADILIERRIIVEVKSCEQLAKAHELQLVNYLVATELDLGLLINFGPSKVVVRRKWRLLDDLRRDISGSGQEEGTGGTGGTG